MVVSSESKIWGFISYLWLLFLLPLLLKKNDKFAQYHAKQGLVLFIVWAIFWVAGMFPLIGWIVIRPVGWIITLIFFIIGIVNSLQGKTNPLPIIGKFAEKLKI